MCDSIKIFSIRVSNVCFKKILVLLIAAFASRYIISAVGAQACMQRQRLLEQNNIHTDIGRVLRQKNKNMLSARGKRQGVLVLMSLGTLFTIPLQVF